MEWAQVIVALFTALGFAFKGAAMLIRAILDARRRRLASR
jgi:hypothetical protein